MSENTADTAQTPQPPSGPAGTGPAHGAAHVESVSRSAAESASDKPAPHGTLHEVEGSPVRNPADLEGSERPGYSDEAIRQVPL